MRAMLPGILLAASFRARRFRQRRKDPGVHTDSSSWEVGRRRSGPSSDVGAGGLSAVPAADRRNHEDFAERCPSILVTIKRETRITLWCRSPKAARTWSGRDKQVAVFDREGDMIYSAPRAAWANAGKDVCSAIARQQPALLAQWSSSDACRAPGQILPRREPGTYLSEISVLFQSSLFREVVRPGCGWGPSCERFQRGGARAPARTCRSACGGGALRFSDWWASPPRRGCDRPNRRARGASAPPLQESGICRFVHESRAFVATQRAGRNTAGCENPMFAAGVLLEREFRIASDSR